MFSACENCYKGESSHCSLPGCTAADGVERAVMTINRKIPGPPIHVIRIIAIDRSNWFRWCVPIAFNFLSIFIWNRCAEETPSWLMYQIICLERALQSTGMVCINGTPPTWMVCHKSLSVPLMHRPHFDMCSTQAKREPNSITHTLVCMNEVLFDLFRHYFDVE